MNTLRDPKTYGELTYEQCTEELQTLDALRSDLKNRAVLVKRRQESLQAVEDAKKKLEKMSPAEREAMLTLAKTIKPDGIESGESIGNLGGG